MLRHLHEEQHHTLLWKNQHVRESYKPASQQYSVLIPFFLILVVLFVIVLLSIVSERRLQQRYDKEKEAKDCQVYIEASVHIGTPEVSSEFQGKWNDSANPPKPVPDFLSVSTNSMTKKQEMYLLSRYEGLAWFAVPVHFRFQNVFTDNWIMTQLVKTCRKVEITWVKPIKSYFSQINVANEWKAPQDTMVRK